MYIMRYTSFLLFIRSSGIWAVVNNAAIEPFGDIEFIPVDEMKRVAEVNFYGMVRVTKAFIPMIRESKGNPDRKKHLHIFLLVNVISLLNSLI